MNRRKCGSCRFFQEAGLAGSGWCHHPQRKTSSTVKVMVRRNELSCRNDWAHDLWEPAKIVDLKDRGVPFGDGLSLFQGTRLAPLGEDEFAAVWPGSAGSPMSEPEEGGEVDVVLSEARLMPDPPAEWPSRFAEAPPERPVDVRTAILRARETHLQRLRDTSARPVVAPIPAAQAADRATDESSADRGERFASPVDPPPSIADAPSLPTPPLAHGADPRQPRPSEVPVIHHEPPPALERSPSPWNGTEPVPAEFDGETGLELIAESVVGDGVAPHDEPATVPVEHPRERPAPRCGHERTARPRLWPWQPPGTRRPRSADLAPERPLWSIGPSQRGDVLERDFAKGRHTTAGSANGGVEEFENGEQEWAQTPSRPYRPWEVRPATEVEPNVPHEPPRPLAPATPEALQPEPPVLAETGLVMSSRRRDDRAIDDPPAVVADSVGITDQVLAWAPSLAAELPRICRTCRDFRPSEGGDRGWCANEWAFKHSRVVHATDETPCESMLGSWWLPVDDIWLKLGDVSSHGQPTERLDRAIPSHRERERPAVEMRERRRS